MCVIKSKFHSRFWQNAVGGMRSRSYRSCDSYPADWRLCSQVGEYASCHLCDYVYSRHSYASTSRRIYRQSFRRYGPNVRKIRLQCTSFQTGLLGPEEWKTRQILCLRIPNRRRYHYLIFNTICHPRNRNQYHLRLWYPSTTRESLLYFIVGTSLIIHTQNPHAPIVYANYHHFEITELKPPNRTIMTRFWLGGLLVNLIRRLPILRRRCDPFSFDLEDSMR